MIKITMCGFVIHREGEFLFRHLSLKNMTEQKLAPGQSTIHKNIKGHIIRTPQRYA